MKTHLDLDSLQIALHCLRYGLPLGSEHPLSDFISFQHVSIPNIGRFALAEIRIYEVLTQVIRRQLNHHRQQCGLIKPANMANPYDLLKRDFASGNHELQAWSLLYYRFICVDLDLSIILISRLVNEPVRTITRRQQLGTIRLLRILIKRESKTIAGNHKASLRTSLPLPVMPMIYGRNEYLQWAINYLLTMSPKHLYLYGEVGVGKSTLALGIAHRLIDLQPFKHAIWLDNAKVNSDWIISAIAKQVGIANNWSAISSYFLTNDTLIVLDDADYFSENTKDFRHIQTLLGATVLIINTRHTFPPNIPHMGCLQVRALDKAESLQWLFAYKYISEHQENAFMDKFQVAFERLGGNPRALQQEFLRL
jgi:hypothetical protein